MHFLCLVHNYCQATGTGNGDGDEEWEVYHLSDIDPNREQGHWTLDTNLSLRVIVSDLKCWKCSFPEKAIFW